MRSRLVLVLNVLIVIAVLASAASLSLVGLTALQAASSLSIGTPSVVVSGGSTQLKIPVTLTNDGLLSLSGVVVGAVVTNGAGNTIVQGSAGPISVAPGSKSNLTVSAVLNQENLSAVELKSLLTTSQNFSMNLRATTSIPPFVSLDAMAVSSLTWGAPVAGLTEGPPTINVLNLTSASVSIPVSFSDSSSFISVTGTISGVVMDQAGNKIGVVEPLPVSVAPGGSFSGTLTAVVQLSSASSKELVLGLTFTSSMGTFTTEVSLSA